MSGEYSVKASEIRALSTEARRSLAAWDARVRALPTAGDKPQKPAMGVQIQFDTAPMREARPLPIVLIMPPRAESLLSAVERGEHPRPTVALDDARRAIESAWERDAWERQRDPCTVIRYQAPDGQCGVIHVRDGEAASIARALTKGTVIKSGRPARVDVKTPAAIAATATIEAAPPMPVPVEDARLPEAIATIASLTRALAERDATIAALRAELAARPSRPLRPTPPVDSVQASGDDPWAQYRAGIEAARRMLGVA